MKYNKKYIWYLYIISLPIVLFLLFFLSSKALESEEEGELFSNFLGINSSLELLLAFLIIIIGYSVLSILFCYLYWSKINYYINDNDITLEKGIIFKRRIVVPYEKMHAVTIDRSLIARLFGLSKLAIDSGNTSTSGINEIEIFDTKNIIVGLENELKEKINIFKKRKIKASLENSSNNNTVNEKDDYQSKEKSEEKELTFNFDKKVRTKMIVCSFTFYFLCVLFFLFYIFTMVAFIVTNGFNLGVIFIGFLIYFVLIVIAILIGKLVLLIQYYNYKVIVNNEDIIISYGFFHIHKMVISKDRIKGMVVEQDIVQKKKGYAVVKVEMLGLSEQSNDGEVPINKVLPFIPFEMVNMYLKELDDEYKTIEITNKCRKNSFRYFIILPLFFTFLGVLPFILGFITSFVSLIIFASYLVISLIIVVLMILRYKNQGIEYDKKNVYFTNGVITQKYYIIPWNSIVTIGTCTTPLRNKNGIVSIYIDYYSSKLTSRKVVAMLDKKYYAELLLRYDSVKNFNV